MNSVQPSMNITLLNMSALLYENFVRKQYKLNPFNIVASSFYVENQLLSTNF